MSEREVCGLCGRAELFAVLDLGHSPLANAYPATEYEHAYAPLYPLRLVTCAACRLVQLSEVVDDAILWGGDYGYYTGTSAAAVEHFARYAAQVVGRHVR